MAFTTSRIALVSALMIAAGSLAACGSDSGRSSSTSGPIGGHTSPPADAATTMPRTSGTTTDPMAGARTNDPRGTAVSPQTTEPGTQGLSSEADESGSSTGGGAGEGAGAN